MRLILSALAACLAACGVSESSVGSDGTSQARGAEVAAPPHATLTFEPGRTTTQRGPIVRGGHVDVSHAASRFGRCANATQLSYERFSPGGQLASSDEAFGFDVPGDATHVELWFHAVGPDCDEWDSNYGANWSFPVLATRPADIGWAAGTSSSRAPRASACRR